MSHFRNTSCTFHFKFREKKTRALVISKRLKFPRMTEQIQILQRLLARMLFQRSKSTLDSLKSVFNVFRTKPLLGVPEIYFKIIIMKKKSVLDLRLP